MEHISLPASYKCVFHAFGRLWGFYLTGIWGTCERHLQHAVLFLPGSRGAALRAGWQQGQVGTAALNKSACDNAHRNLKNEMWRCEV